MAGTYETHRDINSVLFTRNSESKVESIDSELTRNVKHDLVYAKNELSNRGLHQAFIWCSELAVCVKNVKLPSYPEVQTLQQELKEEAEEFEHAKGMFSLKEYFRASFFSEHLKHPLCRFLHLYSYYCAYEQKVSNDKSDTVSSQSRTNPSSHLIEIAARLGPAYMKATKRVNYPAVPKGIKGVGDYEYKTKVASSKKRNSSILHTVNPTKSIHLSPRKLTSRIDDQIHDEEVVVDEDLSDFDVSALGEDMEEPDDTDLCVSDNKGDGKTLPTFSLPVGVGAEEHEKCGEDSYLMYLYGVVLKQIGHRALAREVLCWAIHLKPHNWAAWSELADLIGKRRALEQLDLPRVWQREMFLCQVFAELSLDADCLSICDSLVSRGLRDSGYLRVQQAAAYRNIKELDMAIEQYEFVERKDPFRVSSMDVFSNLLFVKERRMQLSILAAKMMQVAKYTVETCCVVANYMSLRGEHEKAAVYFQRALKLNPKFVSAYTLMGYEYMEMKNVNQAIQCYRNALKINRREFRAWFGLGQTYEVLRLFNYSIYYFKQAHRLRPYDSRMIIAMGEAFEKKEMVSEAKKCYVKAHSVGDIEGTALLRLAKLYHRLGETYRAADAYDRYVIDSEGEECDENAERGAACVFLAEFMLLYNEFEQAEEYAKKAIVCAESQELAKSVLKEISHKRELANAAPESSVLDNTSGVVAGNRTRSSDDDQPRLPPPPLRNYNIYNS